MTVKKSKKNKFKLLVVISWLWARLKLTIELSRLTIFRLLPKPPIQSVVRFSKIPPSTFWTFDNEQLYFTNFDPHEGIFSIYQLPPLSKN